MPASLRFCILLIVSFSQFIFAQPTKILSGKVTDGTNPISAALVRIQDSENSTFTDVNGNFQTELIIPESARAGQRWSVIALERNEISAEVIAKSNNFVVSAVQPRLQPIITIWPHSGPPRTLLSVVGSNFPSMSEIEYTFGESGATPYLVGNAWTEINGTFAIDLIIPNSADPGEDWLIYAEDVNDPNIQTTSPEFTVEEP